MKKEKRSNIIKAVATLLVYVTLMFAFASKCNEIGRAHV